VGEGKEIHRRRRRRRRAAENLLHNQKDFVRISSHNFGKNTIKLLQKPY
jgi:Mn-dependent DtxR family transcriptional regulator